ncbi:MAG: zinc ribbon domain-containing protein [Promethearchaeota archaeon]|nr:MAG: zinc ribbon domain-containing protein [Candidatus Lokiarchaeota archaeon]
MPNKLGIILLIIGGILMIISSTIGSIGIYEVLYGLIDTQIPSNLAWTKPILEILITIMRWIADIGGVAVIIGALFIAIKQFRFGKWLVGIGLTFGTLALIIWLISQIVDMTNIVTDPQILLYLDNLEGFFTYNTGLQFGGVTVAIIGRNFIKKPEEIQEEEAEITEEKEETDSTTPIPFQNISCPSCGASLPFNAEFCSECGKTFERE